MNGFNSIKFHKSTLKLSLITNIFLFLSLAVCTQFITLQLDKIYLLISVPICLGFSLISLLLSFVSYKGYKLDYDSRKNFLKWNIINIIFLLIFIGTIMFVSIYSYLNADNIFTVKSQDDILFLISSVSFWAISFLSLNHLIMNFVFSKKVQLF